MIKLLDVSYARLGTRDLDGATKFATDYLGLEISHPPEGRGVFQVGREREHTLCYFEGSPQDHVAAFEVGSRSDLEDAQPSLSASAMR